MTAVFETTNIIDQYACLRQIIDTVSGQADDLGSVKITYTVVATNTNMKTPKMTKVK